MADRSYRRDRIDRNREPGYTRQAEQFESDRSWRDDEQGYRQMGEAYERDDYGQFDAAGQSYSRDRDYSGDRDWRRDEPQRSRAARDQTGRYSAPGYGAPETGGFASFTSNDYGGSDFSSPRYGGGSRPYTGYGAYPPGYGYEFGAAPRGEYSARHDHRNERGWLERAGDEVASWFGDEDAARRREQDHSGRGPSGYTRSDERILEDANDALTRDWRVDATSVQVLVTSGEVTLDGTVPSRAHKRRAEDVVEDLSGVKHVQNNLRVREETAWDRNNTGTTAAGREKS
jgi:osmotically-inducible protein OsmY